MDKFRTEVFIDDSKQPLKYDSNLMFIGSCFASNIGQYFTDNCLNTLVNPFGVLYNPFSIANSIERLLEERSFTEDEILYANGMYHTFFHHSQFSRIDKHAFLEAANTSFHQSVEYIKKADVVLFTFGTSWVYEHLGTQTVVSNCHKYPASDFNRYMLSVDEIVERYEQLLASIRKVNNSVRFIFTVSPVRHWKDGAHGNQLSKSTLLLAIDKLTNTIEGARYFPAYELLLDDLRDYRFFADDMLHPSAKAIEYIREKFISSQYADEDIAVLKRLAKLVQASNHRPFNVATDEHQSFVRNHINKVNALQKKCTTLNLKTLLLNFEKQRT
ncbi:GSCFA domain-containing protein [Carboxylicivirga marina]|uniref:GSCFA domain-containing protein n=1 Tax=Carboxylicivirga marina TaxID=2800988 RepID=A0ABS1HP54_9BACT|nr:GSCFA domain-containing protein [Carboxylicivirga marina]MBK3519449.1 GSCFA domain-containing protein [Carboxylicivirga marina]